MEELQEFYELVHIFTELNYLWCIFKKTENTVYKSSSHQNWTE